MLGKIDKNMLSDALLAEGLISTTDKSKLNGIASDATKNSLDSELRDRATHTGTQAISTIVNLQTTLNAKEPSLPTGGTTTHYLRGDKTWVTLNRTAVGLANVDNTSDANKPISTAVQAALDLKAPTVIATTSVNGLLSALDKTKLDGIASGATVNSTDAELRDRSTHSGTQAINTIVNLQTTLDGKASTSVVTTTISGLMSFSDKVKLDGIASGATVNATDSALRDRSTHTGTQAADTITETTTIKMLTATERTKLSGIATGATTNDTDANLKNRANHTGTQAISTIASLQTTLDLKAPLAAPALTGNATLDGSLIESRAFRGVANGYAPLGADGKIPSINLPENGSYKGNWDASTNTPTITAGSGTNGDTYTVSVAGTQSITGSSVAFSVGDQIRFTTNGNKWERIPNTQSVSSVAGLTGTISYTDLKAALSLVKADVGLTNVDNTSDANKPVSTAQQTALNLKANLASPTFTGTVSGITKSMVGLANVDNTSDVDKPVSTATASAITASAATLQPLNSNLTSIAALTTTSYGRSFLDRADAAAGRTLLGLGTSSTVNTGTSGAVIGLLSTANTWSGTQTISHASSASVLQIQSIAGQESTIRFRTSTSERWRLGKNQTAESGSNNGSDLALYRYDDTGTVLGTALTVSRATGNISFEGNLWPVVDNTKSLGYSGNRWSNIYTAILTTANAQITGGVITGITDIAIADGGTGASTVVGAKTNLALENVDNTSDANKPVSTAQATAISESAATRQPLNSNLTSIAALTTTLYGRSFLDRADESAGRALLGLGTAAVANTGTSGSVLPFLNGINTWSANQNFSTIKLGGSTVIGYGGVTDPRLGLTGTSASGSALGISRWSADTGGATLAIGKSRGSNVGTYAALALGDEIGSLKFFGDDGSSLVTSASITATTAEIFSSTTRGTYLDFLTVAPGSTTLSTRLRLTDTALRGITDNVMSIGTTGQRMANVYTAILTTANAQITGGTITNITDIAIADGGTGSSTASGARTNLGLGNVDNTSDINKPVSTATQAAIDAKNASNLTALDVDGANSTIQTELSKAALWVKNIPMFDWKTGESAATRTARLVSVLNQGAIYGGCDIKSAEFALDPFKISANMTIEMSPGTLLDFSDSTAVAGTCITLGTDSIYTPGTSTLNPSTLLPAPSANIVQDTRVLKFSSAHGLLAGDRGYVHRNIDNSWIGTDIAGTSRTYYRAGEYFTVVAVVSSTEVEVDRAWLHSYLADGDTIIIKLQMTTMVINGGNVRGRYEDIDDGEDTVNNSAIVGYNLLNSSINDLHVMKAEQAGLSLRRCINTAIENYAFEDYNSVSVGLNYGLALLSCSDITVRNPNIRSKRHAMTLTGGIGYGVPNRFIDVIGGVINGDAMAFDSHGHSEHYTVTGSKLIGGAVLGGDFSNLINCEIYTGRTGDYTGVGVMYRERKGCNTRVVGCRIYTTANPGGRYPVQLNIMNVDDTAFRAADQGGVTEVDVIIYGDFTNSTQIRLGGGVVASETMVWKIKAQALDIQSDVTSDIDSVSPRTKPVSSAVCYLDPSANLGDHQLVYAELDNIRFATSSAYAPRETIIVNSRAKGVYADLDGTARGLSVTFADASYRRSLEVRNFVIRGMQGAGLAVTASGIAQDVDVRLYNVDSRDNSQETATSSAERAAIFLSNIKNAVIQSCIVGDEQSSPTQNKRISLQNCGTVELDGIVYIGSNVSDDYTGTASVIGRNFKNNRLTRTDGVNISAGVTTYAGGAAIEELTGNIGQIRTYNLSSSNFPGGYRRYIYRTTGGAGYTWSIAGLYNLAINQWVLIEFDYAAAAWKVIASGDVVARRQWTEYYASDANPSSSLASLTNGTTYIFTGTLTAARAITLSTTNALQYDRKRFINNGTNYWWDIGGLFYLLPGEECTVEYNGSAWVLIRSPKGPTLIKQSAVRATTVTGDSSNQTLATIPIPPMGPNDQLSVYNVFNVTSSANAKTVRFSYGGTSFLAATITSTNPRYTDERFIANRGVTNSQVSTSNPTSGNWGSASAVPLTASVDTSISQNVVISGQMTTTTEEIALELYRVILHRA